MWYIIICKFKKVITYIPNLNLFQPNQFILVKLQNKFMEVSMYLYIWQQLSNGDLLKKNGVNMNIQDVAIQQELHLNSV